MNAPIKHLTRAKAALFAALLLGLGASALADGTTPAQTTTAQTATPTAPGQPGLRAGQGPRGAGPKQMAPCTSGEGMAMKPGGPKTTQPTLPAPSSLAQPGAPKAPKGDKMDKGMGPKEKGMGKDGKDGGCPPAPKGMGQAAPRPGAAALNQTAPNPAPAARDLSRLDALAAQTSDARIRGYLNDARTYLQSASKAQQKAGRDLLRAAEALVKGIQAPQR